VELTERDFDILRLVYRFRFCLGRHIRVLCGFSGARATDRRLKMLIDAGYLKRKKYIYGIPYLYTLPHKGRIIIGANKREDKIRIERITHDIYVLDTLIYLIEKYKLPLNAVESEKELNIKYGFGAKKHHPDFVFSLDNNNYAVEIELSVKSKEQIEQNIRDNYMRFDCQIWIVDNKKVFTIINNLTNEYSNIEIIRLEEVRDYVRTRYS